MLPATLPALRLQMVVDGLVEDLVRLKAFHRDAHQAATLVMAEGVVRLMDMNFADHHDTNRYINGYIDALHDIGLESIPLKPYKRSGRHDQFVDRLEVQHKKMVKVVERITRRLALGRSQDMTNPLMKNGKPRKKRQEQRWFKKLERDLIKAQEREERAFAALAAAINNESILFMPGRKGRLLKSGRIGKSRLATVRTQIYGGSGAITLLGEQVIVELHNLEPHSRIIETRPGYGFPYKTAMNQMSILGMKRVSNRYIERQAELFNRRIVTPGEIRAHNATRHAILFAA